MDPIEPWIDAEEVRRLARQLTSPTGSKTPKAPSDPGFGPGFEGFIPRQQVARVEQAAPREEEPAKAVAGNPVTLPPRPKLREEEPVVTPRPVPVAKHPEEEPKARPKARPEVRSVPEVKAPVEPKPLPQTKPEVRSIPEPRPAPEQKPEVRAVPAPRPDSETEPVARADSKPFPVPKAAERAEVKPEPTQPKPSVPVVTPHADDEAKPFLIKSPEKATPKSPEVSGERGPLVARMERFRAWLGEKVDARGMFVLDRDGNPVVDDPVYGKLHFLARSLAQAYRPSDGGSGNVHVKIGSDAYLAVVPVQTDFGALVLGTVLPKPLEASAVALIAASLERSLQPSGR